MNPEWADLPLEILAIISDSLPKPIDVFNFRRVCRSWRFSSSPRRNNLSPNFPLTGQLQFQTVYAAAVYLLRPRSDPSKPWLVSVQEPVAGKLVLRHALTHEKIDLLGENYLLDLSSDDWISATRISRSFEYGTQTLALVSKNSDCTRLVGLGELLPIFLGMYAFRLGLSSGDNNSVTSTPIGHFPRFQDWVKFNQRIYVVDDVGDVYVLVDTDLIMRQVNYDGINSGFLGGSQCMRLNRLVVSDGDLYMVSRYRYFGERCQIYKLEWNHWWKEVGDLGDRVFFIAKNGSFSVSARDLPPPWRPNCIVLVNSPHPHDYQVEVVQLGESDGQIRLISSLQGYSDLFAPPSSWMENQASLQLWS